MDNFEKIIELREQRIKLQQAKLDFQIKKFNTISELQKRIEKLEEIIKNTPERV